jgi:hypothetical protein
MLVILHTSLVNVTNTNLDISVKCTLGYTSDPVRQYWHFISAKSHAAQPRLNGVQSCTATAHAVLGREVVEGYIPRHRVLLEACIEFKNFEIIYDENPRVIDFVLQPVTDHWTYVRFRVFSAWNIDKICDVAIIQTCNLHSYPTGTSRGREERFHSGQFLPISVQEWRVGPA